VKGELMNFDTIILKKEEGIATLTLNRPEVLNAFNRQMWEELIEAIDVISKDSEIKVLVITGAGRAFSAGADRSMHPLDSWGGSVQTITDLLHRYYDGIILPLFNLSIPTIAMVNGVATGWGFDFSLACDMRLGSENTRFFVAFTPLGLTPAAGGAWLLPRIVGLPKATEIILTADFIEAEEAERLGILNRVVPSSELERETMALAKKLSQYPPLANRLTKLQLHKGLNTDLATALELGAVCQAICQSSEYTVERFTAFGKKQKPEDKKE